MRLGSTNAVRNPRMIAVVRVVHGLVAIPMFAATVVVWHGGVAGSVNLWLYAATGALVLEVVAVALFRGYCPVIYLHRRYGDDRRLFELFMLWRFAKYVFTTLLLVTMAGYALALVNMD